MAPRGDAWLEDQTTSASSGARQIPDELSADDFCWLVGSLCGLLGIAFNPALLRQRSVPPYDRALVERSLFDVGVATIRRPALDSDNLPALARLKTSSGSDHDLHVIVVKVDETGVSYFMPRATTPTLVSHVDFNTRLTGELLVARATVAPPSDPDSVSMRPAFGFRWFVPELLKHKRLWRNVLMASLAIQLLALGAPLITQSIIDRVVVHRTESTLIALGIGLAIFAAFSAGLTWIRQFLVLHTGMRIDAVLGASVFKHLVELPPRYFEHRPTGVIAARLHGIEQIRDFLASAAISLVLDLPFLSICLALMFFYSVPLTLIVLGVLGAIVLASLAVSPVFQTRLNCEFLLGARNQAFVTEFVAGIETVKSLQMEPVLQRRYGDFLASHLHAGFMTRQVANTYNVVAQTLEQIMTIAILIVGAWIVMRPTADASSVFTIGMLVAFQMFASRLSQPMLRLVGLWQQFQQARLAVKRLGDLMDAPTEPYRILPTRAGSIATPSPTSAEKGWSESKPIIEIRDLAFRYDDDRPLLFEDLNLHIRAGECVGLVGPSGCGKSTLARLLLGFYRPTLGSILVDGIDTRHLAANELRASFGVVPQETVLYSGTVLDNLMLANPRASFNEVVAACRMAEIHQVIEQLPQGYQTEIGERGAGLSGGQKQRIAIARALLRRPKVLIFDEATSSLDQPTAESLARTVNALRGKVAIVFITHHRPANLKLDRVFDLGASSPIPEKKAAPLEQMP